MDEVHLADLDNFDRHEQRDGYQHLEGTKHMAEKRLRFLVTLSGTLLSLGFHTDVEQLNSFEGIKHVQIYYWLLVV